MVCTSLKYILCFFAFSYFMLLFTWFKFEKAGFFSCHFVLVRRLQMVIHLFMTIGVISAVTVFGVIFLFFIFVCIYVIIIFFFMVGGLLVLFVLNCFGPVQTCSPLTNCEREVNFLASQWGNFGTLGGSRLTRKNPLFLVMCARSELPKPWKFTW